ncbi:MAG: hypothetical protein GYB66_04090 [Chloroflexi bacterium]|nr:hypothetical protein [Chloroflexota bacterium]
MATSLRDLQAIIGFTEQDLNANRRGRLSKAQREAMEIEAGQQLRALLLIPMMLSIWVVLSIDLAFALPVLVVMGSLIGGIIGLHRDHLKRLQQARIRKLSGDLSKLPQPNRHWPAQYVISIGKEQLAIDPVLYRQLPEGRFVLYLLDDASEILCMEPLRRKQTSKAGTSSQQKKQPKPSRQTKATANQSARKGSANTPKRRRTSTNATSRSASSNKRSPAKSATTSGQRTKSAAAKSQPTVQMARPRGDVKAVPLKRTRHAIKHRS